jgi:Ca2+-binding EF-hand superfamily protein
LHDQLQKHPGIEKYLSGDPEKELTSEEFTKLFSAASLSLEKPSRESLVILFEILDENHTGMISAANLRSFLLLRGNLSAGQAENLI